jgi:hypothetical protein
MLKRLTGPQETIPETSSEKTTVQKSSGRIFSKEMKTELIKSILETWFRATGFIASGEEVERFDFDNNRVFHTIKLKLKKKLDDT